MPFDGRASSGQGTVTRVDLLPARSALPTWATRGVERCARQALLGHGFAVPEPGSNASHRWTFEVPLSR